ncbi:MAG: 50S ribosomal protein L23 [Eubacteriales bacterium]|nr:50S ribosomal protein L23 [Eubacteriales bacterium]
MKTPYDVIIKPVVSEKSMEDAQKKKYTFKVAVNANRTEVKNAVEEIFDVEVKKVNIMNVVGKKKRMGRYVGTTAATKKAVVTLTPASKEIEFFQSL